jgi:hypothetical protein
MVMPAAIREDHPIPVPSKAKTRTSVSLRPDQREALRSLARETGAPIGELVRRATDAYLAARIAGYVPGLPTSGPVSSEAGAPASAPRT